jgi:hypothetical protein
LFDSRSLAKTPVCGLSTSTAEYAGGHGEGVTSADIGEGSLFAIDRTSRTVKRVDLATKQPTSSSGLSGEPDYVRWVKSTREVWVTEPDQEQIEVFALTVDGQGLVRKHAIAVKGGPESLVIDDARGKAYTHLWGGATVAVDLATHAVSASFANGCQGSRGIAIDPGRAFLFAGCSEGKVVVLDLNQPGRVLGSEKTASGVDIIATNLRLRHLYAPAASDGSVSVFGVGSHGALTRLGTFEGAPGAHCVAGDDHSRIWVCAPREGALQVFEDTFSP